MIWKLAPLAAPNVIQRPSTPQWAPPRPAIMPLLASSGHARGDCSTVHLEADANLTAHLNANLDASGVAAQWGDRLIDQATTQPTGRSCFHMGVMRAAARPCGIDAGRATAEPHRY